MRHKTVEVPRPALSQAPCHKRCHLADQLASSRRVSQGKTPLVFGGAKGSTHMTAAEEGWEATAGLGAEEEGREGGSRGSQLMGACR